jgi:hypothetical protein
MNFKLYSHMYRLAVLTMLVIGLTAELRVSDFAPWHLQRTSQPKGTLRPCDLGFWPVFTGTYDSTGQLLLAYSDINGDK